MRCENLQKLGKEIYSYFTSFFTENNYFFLSVNPKIFSECIQRANLNEKDVISELKDSYTYVIQNEFVRLSVAAFQVKTFFEVRDKEKVKPIFDKFHSWLLEKQQTAAILNSSKTAEAINYCLKRWDKLTNYLNYSFLTPDTNAAERAVKPFVMSRKNFLFSGSGTGARSTCFMFTLIETAKANSKNPEDYLRCHFEKAPYAQTVEDWNKLLPWNIEIPPFKMRGEWVE